MIVGKMTLRMSIQSSGLNLSAPSLSKSKSFVRRAQSFPKLYGILCSVSHQKILSEGDVPLVERVIAERSEPVRQAAE